MSPDERPAAAAAPGVRSDVVLVYFACLNTEDWDRMATLWTPDASLRAVGARPRTGREEVLGYFRKLFEPWETHLDSPTRLVRGADAVVAEVSFTGRSAAGHDAAFDAVDVFDLRDGRIAALSTWYDLVAARRAVAQ